jgi:transketolase
VLEVDGHDMAAVVSTLEAAARPEGLPCAVIAHTLKGRGVSFMEGDYAWHMGVPTPEQFATAMAELGEAPEGDA